VPAVSPVARMQRRVIRGWGQISQDSSPQGVSGFFVKLA
jgi:hypothetical protein